MSACHPTAGEHEHAEPRLMSYSPATTALGVVLVLLVYAIAGYYLVRGVLWVHAGW